MMQKLYYILLSSLSLSLLFLLPFFSVFVHGLRSKRLAQHVVIMLYSKMSFLSFTEK